MHSYKSILVAVECSQSSKQVLKKAAEFLDGDNGVKLHIVHVVLDLIIADWAGSPGQIPPPWIRKSLQNQARIIINPLSKKQVSILIA